MIHDTVILRQRKYLLSGAYKPVTVDKSSLVREQAASLQLDVLEAVKYICLVVGG